MPDIITNIKTVDIQVVDETRSDITTVKLDNPRENLRKSDVSAAFASAFVNGWLLTNKSGRPAKYLGDVTINTSTKIKLNGEDYYVTPSSLTFPDGNTQGNHIQSAVVTGAYIQGYRFENKQFSEQYVTLTANVSDNGLTIEVNYKTSAVNQPGTFDLILVIQGEEVTIPCTVNP